MAADEKKMTDEEMALSRFEMEEATLNGDWSDFHKAMKECAQRLANKKKK